MRALRRSLILGLAVAGFLWLAAPAFAGFAPGDVIWHDEVFHTGVDGYDAGVVIKLDGSGNAIIAAEGATSATTQELRMWSYKPTGLWNWEGHWNGPGSTFEDVGDMALDGASNAYTVGATSPAAAMDIYVTKYLNNGTYMGDYFYSGTGGNDDARAVCANAAGDVWVTGMSQAADGDQDVVTIKLDSTLAQQWVKRYNSPYDRFDAGYAITLRGNALFVAGTSNRLGHGYDLILIKYDATTGKCLWVKRYDDPLHRNEAVLDVVATSTSVYVCGAGKDAAGKPGDAMIVRFSSGGALKWVKYLSGGGGQRETFLDMQRSPNGNIVVCGIVSRKASGQDMAAAAYRTDGTLRWGRFMTSAGKRADAANALDIDGGGKVYVTGETEAATGYRDLRTNCYSPAGATMWTTPFIGASGGDDWAQDIAVYTDAVWVTGGSFVTGHASDQLTIKYEK